MRRLSITTKITIWYTVFLLILTVGVLAILTYTGNVRAGELAQTKLTTAVADAIDKVEAVGENFIIDNDLDFYDDGVYLGVYDENEELLEGRRPAELPQLPKLKDKHIYTLKDDKGDTWYVYDSRFEIKGNPVWIRGIVKDFAAQSTFSFMIRISAIALPIMVIVAALGGYLITRRAFGPVRRVLETVEEISEDGDLSRRIDLEDMQKNQRHGVLKHSDTFGVAKDEIHKLAHTFNGMFDKLEQSFEEEKQFTSDVSHELRTPLAVIISQSDYAKEDEGYRQQALDVINREAKRMAGLVNRLLTLARSDSGRLKLNKETVNLSTLCESVVEQQTPLAAEKNMTIIANIDNGIEVQGDEEMLIRVLLNLVDNAVKYGSRGENGEGSAMAESTPEDETSAAADVKRGHIKIELHCEDGFACFTVEDDGPGIEEKYLDKIWERFYRVDTLKRYEGSGLGLSMVRALVKAHGGRAEAESVVGEGSCFRVCLPL